MTLDEYLIQHPTPWTVHPCGCKDVCWCRMLKSSSPDEDYFVDAGCINAVQANLLAAAPEMLAIIEVLLAGHTSGRAKLLPSQVYLIRNTIAKAKGEPAA